MSEARENAVDGDGVRLSGWGRSTGSVARVVRPQAVQDVQERLAKADPARGLLARGLGRSYGDGAQNGGGEVLDLTGMNAVERLDTETGLLTAGAGLSLDDLMRRAIPYGWFLAESPGTRFVTLGGALANDIHGKNHHRDGGIASQLRELDLLTPDGELHVLRPGAEGGARELLEATLGGLGLTGVMTRMTVQLTRIETAMMRVDTERTNDIDETMERMAATDEQYRYSVAWVDCTARGGSLGRSVLTQAEHAALADVPASGRRDPLAYHPVPPLPGVPKLPSGVLHPTFVRAFNEVWYRKAPVKAKDHLEALTSYFHPLDVLEGWNRLYGGRGFVQYQFVVPFGQEALVKTALERLAAAHCPSYLAVLKRLRAGSGMLSFPIPGWTLALDLPAWEPELAAVLDSLDQDVAAAGGRVYLAKDARLRPELLATMYPQLERWREVRGRIDPKGILQSDLGRRLELFGAGAG